MTEYAAALVFTMGRVGSSSVHAGLTRHLHALHIHSLNPASLAKWEGRSNPPRNIKDSRRAVALLEGVDGPVLVVTLVRDAIERNLSAAFTAWRVSIPKGEHDAALRDGDAMAAYWSAFYRDMPLRWYDLQMRDGLGVDVFTRPFPDKGHLAFDEGRYRVLVMRSDLGDDTKGALLSTEVGAPVTVPAENVRNRGEFADLYRRFVTTAPLDAEFVRQVAGSRYMRHFFAPDPDAYVARWAN
jgi:hypothetical protein